jgi:ribose transport system substrate-binding protein
MDRRDQFWEYLNQGAEDMARMLGLNLIWEAPMERDVEEQIQIFNKAVDAGADAILLAASDPIRISSSVEDAKARGVKIIFVDAPAVEEGVVTLATDNYLAGKIAGDTMIYELEEDGILNGSVGVISVTPENATTSEREKGFRDALTSKNRYTLLNTKYTNGDVERAKAASEQYIEESPDLVGLFGTNEGSTTGMGQAIKERNRKIIGIGFDLTQEIQDLIRSNYLQAVLVQNPYTMGYLGMAEAIAALRGFDTGPPFINTGVSVVTQYTPRRSFRR